jgi:hypothetical protein
MCVEMFKVPKAERTEVLKQEIKQKFINPSQINIFTEQEAEFTAKMLKHQDQNDFDQKEFNRLYSKAKRTIQVLSDILMLSYDL